MSDAYVQQAKWRREQHQVRKRMNSRLPEIAARVFALRSKMYMGCGVHYGLEKSLGYLLRDLNNYDERLTMSRVITAEVIFGELLRALIRAEFSARGWDFSACGWRFPGSAPTPDAERAGGVDV